MSNDSYLEKEGQEILQLLHDHPEVPVAIDTETTGLKVTGNKKTGDYLIGASIAAVIEGQPVAHYFGIDHPTGTNVSRETVDMLEYVVTQGRPLIFANVQFDVLAFQTISGTKIEEAPFYDVPTMAHLIDENMPRSKSVESLSQHYLGEGKVVDAYVEQEKKSGNQNITPEQMFEYARIDAILHWRLWDYFMDHVYWKELPETYWPEKQEFIRVLIAMKRRGVKVDRKLALENIIRGEAEMKRLGTSLGYPPKPTKKNPDPLPVLGPKALNELFIERLGLPVVKRSQKTKAPSFDNEAMAMYDKMLEEHNSPEARMVKEYRGWQKAVTGSYKPYLEHLDRDGRVRTDYVTHGTVTGRLSSREPNLQQIPKSSDKEWNGKVKECFIAEEGYTLINADFSQLELRLGTAYAGEESLKKVFEEGRDIFTEMSEQLGKSVKLFQERHHTKTLVYSMQYGAGIKRIMGAFGVTRAQAIRIRENYFNTYPRFRILSERITATAERTGKVKLWTGRYRRFSYKSESYKAMNSVIQGGAADLVERCMVHVFKNLDSEEECRILLQVHDSMVFEVRNDLVDTYMSKIKELMEDVPAYVGHNDFNVKFAVEVDYWSEAERTRHVNSTSSNAI